MSQAAGTALFPLLPSSLSHAKQARRRVPLYYRRTPEYKASRTFFNQAIDAHPALVARPRTEPELVDTLSWAAEQGLSLSVRGGGHGGGASAVRDHVLLIDTRPMSKVTVVPTERIATVAAGTLLVQLDHATAGHGLVAITGNCPTVGVAGFLLGGGNSFISRRYGLACDNLVGARVVTPSGKTLRASSDENAELFWALRGAGGGNFGIVTELEVRLHAVRHVYGGTLVWELSHARELVSRYQDYVLAGPEHFSGGLRLQAERSGGSVTLFGVSCAASTTDAMRTWDHIRSWGAPRQDAIGVKTFARFHNESGATVPASVNYSRRNGFLAAPLDPTAIESILARLNQFRAIPISVTFEPFNGAVHAMPPKATAFVHRKAHLLYSSIAIWRNEWEREPALQALATIHATMRPHLSGHAFQNYDDRIADASPALRQALYYGDALPRLRNLKQQLDPHNLSGGLIQPSAGISSIKGSDSLIKVGSTSLPKNF